MEAITRRYFIKNNALITAGIIGSIGVGSNIFLPSNPEAAKNDFVDYICGRSNRTGKKVLIAYASMHGSTGEVAKAIGNSICGFGNSVDIKYVKEVKDISQYENIIIGSAIRSDKWLPEVCDFVKDNHEHLSRISVDYFLTCLTLVEKTDEARKKAESFMEPVLKNVKDVKPESIGMFSGVLDYSKYSLPIGFIMKRKMKQHNIKEGDYRDWQIIDSWAKGIAARPDQRKLSG